MKYTKPHLNYNEQVELLRNRGLRIDDAPGAVRTLRRIGYYRLSAYTYVLRAPGPPVLQGEQPKRSDSFVDGATFDEAVALSDFDDRLRSVLLTGLQKIEVGLRVQIGYQLGKSDPHGHLLVEHLDGERCSAPSRRRDRQEPSTAHDDWLDRYRSLVEEAKNEDFVRHFLVKYEGHIPIWAATEFMTFGCLTSLYSLLSSRDAGVIAKALGIKNRDVLHGWLKALNVLRNNCAHNARIWNRATVYPPRVPSPTQTPDRLHHLAATNNHRLYFLAAITAHLLVCLDPATNWPRQLATVISKFPESHGMTPGTTMGFPDDWKELEIWRYSPTR